MSIRTCCSASADLSLGSLALLPPSAACIMSKTSNDNNQVKFGKNEEGTGKLAIPIV